MMCEKLKKGLLTFKIILFISLFANITIAQTIPQPYGIDGTVYELDGITEVWRTVNFSILNNDTGAIISGITGIGGSLGKYSVSISANDGDVIVLSTWNKEHSNNLSMVLSGTIHNLSITLNMTLQNYAPEIQSTPQNQTNEDAEYNYQIQAEDYNLDTITYSLLTSPTNMTINGVTGLINWTPRQQDVGMHQVNVQVSDNSLNTTQNYTLEVLNVNDAPVITSYPSLSAKERENYSYQATATDEDEDGVTFSLVTGSEGMNLTPNGFLNWTPAFGQNGLHIITISASDGTTTTNQTFTITVSDKNNSNPEISSDPVLQAYEEQEYTYQISATDEDNETVTYELIVSPENMAISETGFISWNVTQQDVLNSTAQVTILVTDERNGTATQTFYLQLIDINDQPVIISQPVETAIIDDLYLYQVVVEDPDDSSFRFDLEEYPENLRINRRSGIMKWIPNENETGAYEVTATASDGEYTARQSFSLRVIKTGTDRHTNIGLVSLASDPRISKLLFDKVDSSVKEIIVTFENLRSVQPTITVHDLNVKPRNLEAPSFKVYNYLDITADINETENFNATMTFSLKKDFFRTTNSTNEDIVVLHYKNGFWKELKTTFIYNDSEEYFFEAITDSFSYFAVATRKKAESSHIVVPSPINMSKIFEIEGIVYRVDGIQQAPAGLQVFVINLNKSYIDGAVTGMGPNTGMFSLMIGGTEGDLMKLVVNYKTGTSEKSFFLEKNLNLTIQTDILVEKKPFYQMEERQALLVSKIIIIICLALILYWLMTRKE